MCPRIATQVWRDYEVWCAGQKGTFFSSCTIQGGETEPKFSVPDNLPPVPRDLLLSNANARRSHMNYLPLFLSLCTRIGTGGNNSLLIMGHKTHRSAFIPPIGDGYVDSDRMHPKNEFQSTQTNAERNTQGSKATGVQ